MMQRIRNFMDRPVPKWELKIINWWRKVDEQYKGLKKQLKYWALRKTLKSISIQFNIPTYKPELGDLYVSRGQTAEYIGKGRWVPVVKEHGLHLKLGARIKAHYYAHRINNVIVRNNETIFHL